MDTLGASLPVFYHTPTRAHTHINTHTLAHAHAEFISLGSQKTRLFLDGLQPDSPTQSTLAAIYRRAAERLGRESTTLILAMQESVPSPMIHRFK